MLSLTSRHDLRHDLKRGRQGLAKAHRRLTRGAPWKRVCADLGLVGCIRALEITHGERFGWHPHLHVLLLAGRSLGEEEIQALTLWLSERWQHCVERELGVEQRPNAVHGVHLTPCRLAEYLAKLGLELTGPGRTKRAKNGNRTPMEIGYDYSLKRDARDAELWREYCAGMFGARMLTWSKGLRVRLGLDAEASDEAIVEGADVDGFLARLIDGDDWDRLRDIPGAKARVLEDLERQSPRAPLLVEPKRAKSPPAASLVRRPALPPLPSQQERGYMSRADRKLRLEEVRDHLYVDLGLGTRPEHSHGGP